MILSYAVFSGQKKKNQSVMDDIFQNKKKFYN